MKEDGTMASSEWITYDKNRYYFRSWGGMYTGIHTIGGTKYAFQSWGGLYHDQTFTIGGKTYYANSDGTFATGWVQNGGKRIISMRTAQAIRAGCFWTERITGSTPMEPEEMTSCFSTTETIIM